MDDHALLVRKRATIRSKCTKLIACIENVNADIFEMDHCQDRLFESITELKALDDQIHRSLPDEEYNADIVKCEEYEDHAKRAIKKAKQLLSPKVNPKSHSLHANSSHTTTPMYSVKLPTIKLEPFRGDIEQWLRFWEQFSSSIDSNESLSRIDKHIFLRGYLQDEPKRLIDGISITGESYDTVKKILQDRYGDKNRIIQSHVDFLEAIQPLHDVDADALNNMFIDCNKRIQALQALGENVDGYGRFLAPKILRIFPEDICKRWIIHAKREKISEGSITDLMKFLNEEVEGAITTQKIREMIISKPMFLPSTSAFQVNTQTSRKKPTSQVFTPFCAFCDVSGHWPQNCTITLDVQERIQKLKSSNRCFLCIRKGHNAKNCPKKEKASCTKCKKRHHVSICTGQQTTNTSVGKIDVTPTFTYLQTAKIWIEGPTGLRKLTRCVLDCGSQSSFVHTSLVDSLQLHTLGLANIAVHAFEANSSNSDTRNLVEFTICNIYNKKKIPLKAYASDHKYAAHPSSSKDIATLVDIRRLKLADPTDNLPQLPIEVLIGGDFYWQIVNTEAPIRLSSSLVLLPSNLGWLLSGNRSSVITQHISLDTTISVNHVTSQSALDNQVRIFWELDSMGIVDQARQMSSNDSRILDNFHESYKIEDGRRVIQLPWKSTVSLTSNNYYTAERRLYSLEKRLKSNPDLMNVYVAHMQDYIEKGQVEVAPSIPLDYTKTYYLPHQAVQRSKNGQVLWRIVFDASSHSANSPSLNEALEVGPNLLPEILAVLLRFRLGKQAITGDLTQAFLQLSLHEQDRDATRFLWFNTKKNDEGKSLITDEVITYRFSRLPFGLTSSPFLLSASIRELAKVHTREYADVTRKLADHLYMDDFIVSEETDAQVISIYEQVEPLMATIHFSMTKWASNSKELQSLWKSQDIAFKSNIPVLGVNWNTDTDTLQFDLKNFKTHLADGPTTKRHLLRITSSFYDPLGLYAPVSIIGKMLFQDTWLRGIQWDEILPPDIATRWRQWTGDLSQLSTMQVSRWIGLSNASNVTLHVFCDASERAYGAVLYLRSIKSGDISVHLVCSRSRLTPVKRVTLPRLELLAALVGARLLNYFCRETKFDSSRATLWTDATVALGWIRGNPNGWKTFVCNRVTEILLYTNPAQWRHCPGKDNPADYLSRGVSTSTLSTLDSWWHGPTWLTKPAYLWPTDCSFQNKDEKIVDSEARKQVTQSLYIPVEPPVICVSRFSSYTKLIRTTSWILRFVTNCRSLEKKKNELTAKELENSRHYWLKVVQRECFTEDFKALEKGRPLPVKSKIARFNPFLQDGLIRLGGRLQFAELSNSQQHPLLLDGSHAFTILLIGHTHVRLHHLGVRIVLSELREAYWILRGRQSIKKVLNTCLPCKLTRKLPAASQIEAPLPSDRIKPSPPFTVTGIDFAGPLYVRESRSLQKAYICLFTCATTRAIHLELVSDLTTDKFLMALERFSARRGLPNTIYSDNATTFHAANKELAYIWEVLASSKVQRFHALHGITWKFIVPGAPWWGGWWERMVGSVKRCLKKTLGKACVDEDGLTTVLCGIEAALNSRPIVHDYGIEDNAETLTPAHFLTGQRLTLIPSGPEPVPVALTRLFRRQQNLQDAFWARWSREYLLELRSFHDVRNAQEKHPNIRVGDVVLLQDDKRPRHLWKLARVEKTLEGRDGRIRSCQLSVSGRLLTRPIQLVIPLEVDQGGEDVGN